MGMKFHKFYVGFVNLCSILIAGGIAAVLFVAAQDFHSITNLQARQLIIEAKQTTAQVIHWVNIPFLNKLRASEIVWLLFGLAAGMCLYPLITEILLVKRRRSGIVLLSITFILGIIINVLVYLNSSVHIPWYSLAISVMTSELVLHYYWKRYKTFS